MSAPRPPATLSPGDALLVWEITAGISTLGDIMRRHGLTFDEYDAKMRDAAFVGHMVDCKRYWTSETSVSERVRLKAALLAEDGLLDLYQILKSPDTVTSAKLDAFGHLAKAADLGPSKKPDVGTGERFQININLGEKHVVLEANSIAGALEGETVADS
jgi:hypothetical protein